MLKQKSLGVKFEIVKNVIQLDVLVIMQNATLYPGWKKTNVSREVRKEFHALISVLDLFRFYPI